MSELLRAVLLGAGFLLILAAAEIWFRAARPPVEWTRKFVHFTSGLPVLAFPWIFRSPWTVVVLATFIGGILALTARAGTLRSVHGVQRESLGQVLYPLGIVLLFALARDEPVLYLVSALVLIISDPAAALLGMAYGRIRYQVEEHRRSIEGSLAFFLLTFLSVHLPLLLMTDLSRPVCVLAGVQVAVVVTLLEGISLHGSDNLLIPLASYFLLASLTTREPAVIATHVGVLLGTLAFLALLSRRSQLMKASGVMAAGIFFYLVYALGGPAWMLAPAIAAVSLRALRGLLNGSARLPDAEFQVVALFYATLPATLILTALHLVRTAVSAPLGPDQGGTWAAVFAGAIAGHLGIVAMTQFSPFNPSNRRPPGLALSLVLAMGAALLVAPAALWATGALYPVALGSATAVTLASATAYWVARALPGWPAAAPWNMRLQAACVTGASGVVLLLRLRPWGG